ncbi:hypothetical protein FGW37_05005 [Streptomyces rectiverticillatus]|uniref:hypothetical protein n=1 Tax=Streptomyces rectiverticillatus TaxID=173860 RepID=UPI0015C3C07E|nr:hypothetical protein [Streptomyces rectiverticillatus]QLE71047.1 hypothetical protein FGW37_05005 [Streptomyces rectiverticillatus]
MWQFGTLTNDSDDYVWISCPVQARTTATAQDAALDLTLAEISIGHTGTLYLKADDTTAPGTSTVSITGGFTQSPARWTTSTPATLDIHIHRDCSFTLTDHATGNQIATDTLKDPIELGHEAALRLGSLPPDA